VRHARRRLGGVTGDVLGAACELAVTAVLVVCSAGLADAPGTLPQTTVDQFVAGCGSAAR
jgi:Cobalamin-5-phosphate synthase